MVDSYARETPDAPRTPDEPGTPEGDRATGRTWRRLRPWLLGLFASALVAVLLPTLVARMYAIPSDSMETALHGCKGCDNDRVLVDRLVYRFTDPNPGDIVVFAVPGSWHNAEVPASMRNQNPVLEAVWAAASVFGIPEPSETDFVKRVIAVGGQTVACCDELNRITVDGRPLEEPYIHYAAERGPAQQQPFGPVRVPPGQLWLMGDNRNNSVDSRAPRNGPVPVTNVIGKVRLVMLPLARFGTIDSGGR